MKLRIEYKQESFQCAEMVDLDKMIKFFEEHPNQWVMVRSIVKID